MYSMGMNISIGAVIFFPLIVVVVVAIVRTMMVVRYRSSLYPPRHNSNKRHQNTWVNENLDIDKILFEYETTIVEDI